MFLDKRQIELIKKAIEDFKFIKEEVEFRSNKDYSLEDMSRILIKFKGIEITSSEEYEDIAYLDFEYNNINTCVVWKKDNGFHIGSTFEIYDSVENNYIVEDFLTIKEYENLMNTPKEQMINYAVADLKYYESKKYTDLYNRQRDRLISFLKEEY